MIETIIRPRAEADDLAIIDIRNATRPWLPPISLVEHQWSADPANWPDGEIHEHWVAQQDGNVVGAYSLSEATVAARKHTFKASVVIAEAHRRHGLGGTLCDHMTGRATGHGGTRVYANVLEGNNSARSFAESRGFTATGRALRLSRLALDEANLAGYESVVKELEADGITFRTLAEMGKDETVLRHIHSAITESGRDIPGSEEYVGAPFETWLTSVFSPLGLPDESCVAIANEEIVGATTLMRWGDDSALNEYTGVRREFRGRGVAPAVKRKTIESARDLGLKYMFTGNDAENTAILSINIRLGYEALPAELEYRRDLL